MSADPREPDCGSVLEHLYEYLDGEMSESDCATFAQHLADCAPCLTEYERDQALKALIRRSCACEEAPQQLRTRIIARVTSISVEY